MRTPRKNKPKRFEVRSLKLQPKYRFNQWSTSVVPELKLCGQWLQDLGFEIDERVSVNTSQELLVIRPWREECINDEI